MDPRTSVCSLGPLDPKNAALVTERKASRSFLAIWFNRDHTKFSFTHQVDHSTGTVKRQINFVQILAIFWGKLLIIHLLQISTSTRGTCDKGAKENVFYVHLWLNCFLAPCSESDQLQVWLDKCLLKLISFTFLAPFFCFLLTVYFFPKILLKLFTYIMRKAAITTIIMANVIGGGRSSVLKASQSQFFVIKQNICTL